MGLRPRAVTRDGWGIPLPLEKNGMESVFTFGSKQFGYYSCAKLWSQRYANEVDYEKWWKISLMEKDLDIYTSSARITFLSYCDLATLSAKL